MFVDWRYFNATTLVLHDNRFNGSIPPSWGDTTGGAMLRSNLNLLALSYNALTGTVPATLTTMTALKCVHLRFNPGMCGPRPSNLPYADCTSVPGTSLGKPSGTHYRYAASLQRMTTDSAAPHGSTSFGCLTYPGCPTNGFRILSPSTQPPIMQFTRVRCTAALPRL